jgi:sterol desaturase/sphingolipid hydroxylase (fatty acid hydroxylase superfamily)
MAIVTSALAGVCAWTLLEYLIHRFLGHGRAPHRNPFGIEHVRHHSVGDYFAPAWKKLAVTCLAAPLLFGLASLCAAPAVAAAFVTGLLGMYLAYEWLHRQLHVHPGLGPYGRWARRHHFGHHFADPRTNHGVTSPLWDVVFGTRRVHARIVVPERLCMAWLRDPATGEVRADWAGTFELRRATAKS